MKRRRAARPTWRWRGWGADDGVYARVGIVAGFLAGVLFVLAFGGRFVTPEAIDPAVWTVISAGQDENLTDPGLGRGAHVVDGALVIRQHAFLRADVLVPTDGRPVGRVAIDVAPASGAARLLFSGDRSGRPAWVFLTSDRYLLAAEGAAWTPRDDAGPWTIEIADGVAALKQAGGTVNLGAVGPGTFDLTAVEGEARIRSIRAWGTDGTPILEQDYGSGRPPAGPLAIGAGVGTLLGLATASIAWRESGPVGAARIAGLLVPPLLVGLVPSASWLWLVEKLYLTQTPAWVLARVVLAASLVPAFVVAALRSGHLAPVPGGPSNAERAWVAAAIAAALLASRDLAGWGWLGLVPGLVFALLPVRVARRAGFDRARAFAVDAPALLAIAALGWSGGAWIAVGWRLVVLLASTRPLLERGPGVAADLLSVLLLAAPASCELAARGTYLADGWDAARLAEGNAGDTSWKDPLPFWSGECGDAWDPKVRDVLVAGGSSTGGAYQFRGEPEAFFSARAHAKLCARLPADTRLTTWNFGSGGRDTFTISRTIDLLLERAHHPAVVVLYTGVNDVVGAESTRTRKQMEAEEAERGAAMNGLVALSMRSRVLTGLSLLVRTDPASTGEAVPAVPLADAEENLRRIAAATEAAGAKLLLVTEFAAATGSARLDAYGRMEARLAGELPDVRWIDVKAELADTPPSELLVDANHLSRTGSERVGAFVANAVGELLGLPPEVAAAP